MRTETQTSLTKRADPVAVLMASTCSRQSGSACFDGLEKGMVPVSYNPEYNPPPAENPTAAEESTVPPVASGTDWFRFAGELLVAEGRITQERLDRAIAAQEGVDRV